MTYKIVDLRTKKIIGTFETAEQAVRAESHLVHEPGETWYAIEAPVVKKTKAKKTDVKKESE
ncbi:MAG: hypothetical protein CL831_00265 [Crocinitomicaceae bacterium]|jgi:hypothetical protein|nr:hypothetical protein [Paracoccaceae bacterium]MAU75290.1 hypothetical protein [Crocinitomicaceae bacterium]|tara:strand:+ start:64 stop:249 length:186 start_codon:yes stop_codon:yes gene_type:complete